MLAIGSWAGMHWNGKVRGHTDISYKSVIFTTNLKREKGRSEEKLPGEYTLDEIVKCMMLIEVKKEENSISGRTMWEHPNQKVHGTLEEVQVPSAYRSK